jgi:hypothetical protein
LDTTAGEEGLEKVPGIKVDNIICELLDEDINIRFLQMN